MSDDNDDLMLFLYSLYMQQLTGWIREVHKNYISTASRFCHIDTQVNFVVLLAVYNDDTPT